MVTKVFCDGCDKEITEDSKKKVSVTISGEEVAYDLGLCCIRQFKERSNPKMWARPTPPTKDC